MRRKNKNIIWMPRHIFMGHDFLLEEINEDKHWLDGRESEWTLGVGDGQGGLACCDSWDHKESDTTEWLNWTKLKPCGPLRPSMFSPRFLSYQLLFRAVPQGSSCQEEHYLLGCLKFLFEFLLSHTPLPPQAISSILMVSVTKYVRKETSPVQFFFFFFPHMFFWISHIVKNLTQHTLPNKVLQFSSVAQSCPTLCDPMNCSTPAFPVHHRSEEHTSELQSR